MNEDSEQRSDNRQTADSKQAPQPDHVSGTGQVPSAQEMPAAPQPERRPAGARSSRMRELGVAVIAILLYLLLLDAAVETFLSGSPLRWIVSGAVAGYAALTALLWQRLRWATKAAASSLVMFGLLAFTVWQPEGLSTGVILLHQPTSTVLSAITLFGILLAGSILVRLRFLPLAGKVAAGLLTIYGAAAFMLGIAEGTTYQALFHGRSLWELLPFWLQGAFLGALALVPIAALFQIIAGVLRARNVQTYAWGTHAVALGMCVVMALAAYRTPYRPPQVIGSVATTTHDRAKFEHAMARLDRLFAIAEGIRNRISPAQFEVQAKAKELGGHLERAFAFVKDEVQYEAYRGALRGANGALMGRAGNAADTSLLLAELLKTGGADVRFARGRLDEPAARALIAQMFSTRTQRQPESPLRLLGEFERELTAMPEIEQILRNQKKTTETLRMELMDRTDRDTKSLAAVLASTNVRLAVDPIEEQARLIGEARDHTWVQVRRGDQWVDLDPVFADSKVGQRFAEPTEILDALPAPLYHHVTFRVHVEYLSGGTLESQTVLEVNATAAELVGAAIFLANVPRGVDSGVEIERATSFQPILAIDEKQHVGLPFDLRREAGSPADISGSLSGSDPTRLAGVWLEISLANPSGDKRLFRRAIVDRIGTLARKAGTAVISHESKDDVRLVYRLLREYQVLVTGAAYNDSFNLDRVTSWILRNRPQLAGFAKLRFGVELDPRDKEALANPYVYPMAAHAFAADVSGFLHQANSDTLRRRRIYYERPAIILFSQGLDRTLGSTSLPEMVAYSTFDIVEPGLRLASLEPSETGDLLRPGVFLTNLERSLLQSQYPKDMFPPLMVRNTSTVMELATHQRIPLRVLTPSARAQVESLGLSAVAKAHLHQDLESGYTVVVPERSPTLDGKPIAAWWRIAPHGGIAIGISETGEGQGLTEFGKDLLRVGAITFLGGRTAACLVYWGWKVQQGNVKLRAIFTPGLCILAAGIGYFAVFFLGGWLVATLVISGLAIVTLL